MRWLIPVFLLACARSARDPDVRTTGVASVNQGAPVTGDDFAKPTNGGRFEPPPTPASTSADPTDHKASAGAIYDGRNYVAPAELAYSKKQKLVIYPACAGGEGPGEHCSLGGFDHAGASVEIDPRFQVAWSTHANKTDRQTMIDKLAATFDALETTRIDRRPWTGTTPLVLPDFGTLSWDRANKQLIATRDGATTKVAVTNWGDSGGAVNVFWSPGVPLAVVQLRRNPGTGGRESSNAHTEGYVVFIELVVVPRP